MSKNPLDSQHAALLLEDKFRAKDNGEIQRITALLHITASLTAQERLEYQALPSYLEKEIFICSHISSGCLPRVCTPFPHGFPDFSVFLYLYIYKYIYNLSAFSKVFGAQTWRVQRLQRMQKTPMVFKDEG